MKTRLTPWLLGLVVLGVAFRELAAGQVQAARDLSAHVFPETWFLVKSWAHGEVPLWLPHARLGQPFSALLYTQVFYAPRVVTGWLFGHVMGPNVLHALHVAWSFSGLFVATRRFGLSRSAAFIAAAPFSLSPFFVEFAQNFSFASTAAWAGWVLWAAEGLRRAPSVVTTAWLAAILGAAFHAGSPEMWLWEATLACAVAWRAWPRLLIALAWAGALGAVVAIPSLELSREWTKPGEVAAGALEWSVSFAQWRSTFVPDGDLPRAGAYWGGDDQRFIFTLFIGAAAVLLSTLGVTTRRARPLVVLLAICGVLALGKHLGLSSLLLEVPPFRLFRYPVKYAVGALFALSVLAGFGARRLAALARRRRLEAPLAWLTFSLGLVAATRAFEVREGLRDGAPWVVLIAAGLFLFARRPAWVMVLVAVELIAAPVERWDRVSAAALQRPSKLAPQLAGAGRLSIRVDLDDVDHEACGPWDADDEPLLAGRDRLSALRFVEEDLRAVGGYGFRDPWRLQEAFARGAGAYDVAGVRTLVRETWAPQPAGATGVQTTSIPDVWVWTRDSALPRGFFSAAICHGAFDALDDVTAVALDDASLPPCGKAERPAPVSVQTLEHAAGSIEQRVTNATPGAVVLADAWYPGWQVTVDGVDATAERAWGFVRAVRVDAGTHVIHWRYAPRSVRLGAALSLLALAAFLIPVVRRRRGAR